MIEETFTEEKKPLRWLKKFVWLAGLSSLLVLLFLLFIWHQAQPPKDFPQNSDLMIVPGSDVSSILDQFSEANYVKSRLLLYFSLEILHDTTQIKAGNYRFLEPVGVFEVARIITEVGPSDPLVRLTIPEGTPNRVIADIAELQLVGFDKAEFLTLAKDFEGKLFPDTYFLPVEFTAEELFELLYETYEERILEMITSHPQTTLSSDEVLVLASILEREANSPESMALVSGVLQNRLEIGMPLQADASVEYVLDKPLSELTPEDLEIDSPYNTYLYTGLPPTPIGNPGEVAVKAALNPTETDYFYYITDPSGTFHFAKTFDEHRQNITRYLR